DRRLMAESIRPNAEVRTHVTGDSLHEFLYEREHMRDEKVSEEEIANEKSYLTGVFPIRLETQDGLLDQVVSMKMLDLPADYLRTYRENVNNVTTEDIQRVAQQNVTPDRAAIVIVGDAAAVLDQAKSYSEEIEIYDTEGNRKQ